MGYDEGKHYKHTSPMDCLGPIYNSKYISHSLHLKIDQIYDEVHQFRIEN